MISNELIYQSILSHLSLIPVDYLQRIDAYLRNFTKKVHKKEENRALILRFAGSWNDMQESDFNDFLLFRKKLNNEM
jgi:hypothetical protein